MPKIEIEPAIPDLIRVRVEGYPFVLLRPERVAGVTIWHFMDPDGRDRSAILQHTAVTEALGIEDLPNWQVG